jgi:hypothetical protein
MSTGGSGNGVAQDATLQGMIAKLGGGTPQGGTGTGIAQDATLQALLLLIGSGGAVGTIVTVPGGTSYNVKASDVLVKMDSSNGSAPKAVLGQVTAPVLGERHAFFWFAWGAGQVPPVISAGEAVKLSPWGGMVSSGAAGLVPQTDIATVGASITYQWDGAEWLQVA